MKKKWSFYVLLLIAMLASCDVSDTLSEGDTVSYTRYEVCIIFHADSVTYRATYNGKEIQFGTNVILRSELAGTLTIYKGDDSIPELEKEMVITPNQKINLIQLPGQTIQLYDSEENNETDPDSNAVKMRFFYSDASIANDSVRMMVYSRKNNPVATTYEKVDTVVFVRGKLSPYVTLNLAKYWASDGVGANFYFTLHDLADPANPKLLTRYATLLSSMDLSTNGNGPVYDMKLETKKITKSESKYTLELAFGTTW